MHRRTPLCIISIFIYVCLLRNFKIDIWNTYWAIYVNNMRSSPLVRIFAKIWRAFQINWDAVLKDTTQRWFLPVYPIEMA